MQISYETFMELLNRQNLCEPVRLTLMEILQKSTIESVPAGTVVMKTFMEILLEKDCFCKTDGSERLYPYSEIEDAFNEYKASVPAEPLVMPKIAEVDTSKLTRLTVVNKEAGRIIEKWDVKIDVSIQDNGRTLKIFYE
jgi:hypothetical protein